TSPVKTTKTLAVQFEKIAHLELDLIQYLLLQQKKGVDLISVKKWIDDYNRRFPDNTPLLPAKDAEYMMIVVDYSIQNLGLLPDDITTLHTTINVQRQMQI